MPRFFRGSLVGRIASQSGWEIQSVLGHVSLDDGPGVPGAADTVDVFCQIPWVVATWHTAGRALYKHNETKKELIAIATVGL